MHGENMKLQLKPPMSRILSAPSIERGRALTLMEQTSAVTHLIHALENLTSKSARGRQPGGLNHWDEVRKLYASRHPLVRRAIDVLADPRSIQLTQATRVLAAASLLVPGTPRRLRAAANSALTLTSMANNLTLVYGNDGTDQLSFHVQFAASIARTSGKPRLVDACLWYVALQSTMSYAAAGYAKLPSDIWRSGDALTGILRTESFGEQKAYEMTQRHPAMTKLVAHSVLALECAFPVVFLAKGRAAPLVLATFGAFHLVNARLMGLGRFVWAFTSTYPAVLYAVQRSSREPAALASGRAA